MAGRSSRSVIALVPANRSSSRSSDSSAARARAYVTSHEAPNNCLASCPVANATVTVASIQFCSRPYTPHTLGLDKARRYSHSNSKAHAKMVLGSPSASTAAKLVYWSGADADSPPNGSSSTASDREGGRETNDRDHGGRSMYVTVFEGGSPNTRACRVFLTRPTSCRHAQGGDIDGNQVVFTRRTQLLHGLAQAALYVVARFYEECRVHAIPTDSAKYLFCRLCLRKGGTWYKLSDLKYESELGAEGILNAMNILSGRIPVQPEEDVKPKINPNDFTIPDVQPSEMPQHVEVKAEPIEATIPPPIYPTPSASKESRRLPIPQEPKLKGPEIIDLTLDEEDIQPKIQPERPSPEFEPPPPPSSSAPSSTPRAIDYSVFADDEEQAELLDLLDCMTMPDLEAIVKQLKLKPKAKKVGTPTARPHLHLNWTASSA